MDLVNYITIVCMIAMYGYVFVTEIQKIIGCCRNVRTAKRVIMNE